MPTGIYDTFTLMEVQRKQEGVAKFWLNFFPRVVLSEQEQIIFDNIVTGTRELAPFVAPNVQGRVLKERGYTTKVFKPAYVKPKHVVDPSRAIPRRAGEAIGGQLSPQQRFDAIVAENLRIERQQIENRWEWMAAMAIIYGEVTVEGDDYPTTTVNFGRHADLVDTLTADARWGQQDADPLADIERMRGLVRKHSGSSVNALVFGSDAWALFTADEKVQALLDKTIRGSESTYMRAIPEGAPVELRGVLQGENGMGRLELYVYQETYVDSDGSEKTILPTTSVVGLSRAVDGVRCFGAIRDKRAGLAPVEMFPKMWDQEDPSVTYTMTQSAPLMVPVEPNATFLLNVTSP